MKWRMEGGLVNAQLRQRVCILNKSTKNIDLFIAFQPSCVFAFVLHYPFGQSVVVFGEIALHLLTVGSHFPMTLFGTDDWALTIALNTTRSGTIVAVSQYSNCRLNATSPNRFNYPPVGEEFTSKNTGDFFLNNQLICLYFSLSCLSLVFYINFI